jgi:replication factor C small subunit
MDTAIFAEKYRPTTLDGMINQKHIVERLKAFVKSGNVPHMLFAGRAGIGKTAAALALASDLYGENWQSNALELNASDERGIDVVRHKVKDFARTKTMSRVGYRLIILDEADALTVEAQQALRRTMETYASVSRFILICNWSSRIIEPIQSRCAVFRFKPLAEADQKSYIDRIAKGEKLKIDGDAESAIIHLTEGDLRKIANIIQACAALKGKITEAIVYDVMSIAKPADVKKMLEAALAGRFEEARVVLQDMLLKQGLAGEDIIKEIHSQIHKLDIDEQSRVKLIEKTGEYEYRLSEGSSDLLQLEALLAQFLVLNKK